MESPTVLREIRLFDSRSLEHNVLKAEILLDNGAVYPVNDLPYNGSAAIVAIDETDPIGSFSVRILESEGENAGLSEIEAYKESPNHDIRYIKLMNESDDFVYDYWIEESGTETFALHGSNVNLDNAANDFTLTVEGDASCSARFDGNSIVVNCPAGAEMTLTIASKTDSTISDAVCISNPSAAWRTLVYMLQHYENLAGKLLPPQ